MELRILADGKGGGKLQIKQPRGAGFAGWVDVPVVQAEAARGEFAGAEAAMRKDAATVQGPRVSPTDDRKTWHLTPDEYEAAKVRAASAQRQKDEAATIEARGYALLNNRGIPPRWAAPYFWLGAAA